MALRIGQRLDRGFSEPLGLLSDCHRRIEYFLEVLIAVDAETAGGPLIPSRRTALEGALRYFAVGAPKHTRDEEESLFPRLRAQLRPARGRSDGTGRSPRAGSRRGRRASRDD